MSCAATGRPAFQQPVAPPPQGQWKVRLPTDTVCRELAVRQKSLNALVDVAARKLGVSPVGALLCTRGGQPLLSDRDVSALRDSAELILTTPNWSPHAVAGAAAAELLTRDKATKPAANDLAPSSAALVLNDPVAPFPMQVATRRA